METEKSKNTKVKKYRGEKVEKYPSRKVHFMKDQPEDTEGEEQPNCH